MITKRRVLIVLLFLLAGAAVNVAVAWGCASRPSPMTLLPKSPDVEYGTYQCVGRWEDTTLTYAAGKIEIRQMQYVPGLRLMSDIGSKTFDDLVPGWSEFHDHEPLQVRLGHTVEGYGFVSFVECAAGWPMWSMRTSYVRRIGSSSPSLAFDYPERHWLLVLPGWDLDDLYEWEPELPCRPIPLGFAVNTLLYTGVLFVPIACMHWARVRRTRRKQRRGLCMSCGYDLRGADHAVCPECGK